MKIIFFMCPYQRDKANKDFTSAPWYAMSMMWIQIDIRDLSQTYVVFFTIRWCRWWWCSLMFLLKSLPSMVRSIEEILTWVCAKIFLCERYIATTIAIFIAISVTKSLSMFLYFRCEFTCNIDRLQWYEVIRRDADG